MVVCVNDPRQYEGEFWKRSVLAWSVYVGKGRSNRNVMWSNVSVRGLSRVGLKQIHPALLTDSSD